jgi:hypothetical protein
VGIMRTMATTARASLEVRIQKELDLSSEAWQQPLKSRTARWVGSIWPIGVALIAMAGLAISDWIPATNTFWVGHPITASLVTGGGLALLVVFGVDQALRIRSRNRWRPIREMLTEKFVNLAAADELLTALCEEFCKQSWGLSAYPDGETYFTLLPQVLAKPATWAPDAFGVYVFEQIGQEGDDTEQTLADWGSVLISESDLAELGAAAQERLRATRRLHGIIDLGLPDPEGSSRPQEWWAPEGEGTLLLLDSLLKYRDADRRIWKIAIDYRNRRRL